MIYNRLIESLLVFLLAFTPLAYGAVHPWSIAIFEVAAALMAFFWILKMLSGNKPEFIGSPILTLFLILIGCASLQFFFSHYPLSTIRYTLPRSIYPWSTKTELLKLISYAIIFLVTLNTIRTKRQITRISWVIITMGFSMSIFYLMRYFGAPAPRGFVNSDHFSAYLGMIIPISLGFLFAGNTTVIARSAASPVIARSTDEVGTTKQSHPRILLFFTIIIMSAALFFTMSRGGMFSFIAALIFIALLASTRRSMKNKGWLILAIAVFIILIIAWLGATPVVERILSFKAEIASRYFGGRLPIWQGTIDIIKDNPIFGTGLGTFNYIFPKYQPAGIAAKHYTYAHSDFLELLSEVGIVGFALFMLCGLWSMVYLFRRYSQRHDPWVTGMSICVFGSLASIFIHSFTDFNLHIPANAVLLSIILALFVSILNTNNAVSLRGSPPKVAAEAISHYLAAVLAVGLLVIYTVAVLRPALADYYASKIGTVPAGKKGTVPDLPADASVAGGDCPLFRAINLDPTNADYHYRLGRLYGKSKAYELQLAEYQSAVRLNPTNSQYHQSLAWAYGRKSEYMDLAHHEFQKAIQCEPNFYYCYYIYANWLFAYPRNENIGKGFELYKKAIQLNPKLTKEVLTKYWHYHNDYEKLVDMLPGTKESDAECFKFIRKKTGLKYAISFAERFLKTYSQNAEIHFWIAHDSFYDGSYSWDFTERHYTVAFENDSRNGFYRLYHGIHLFFRGQYENALKDLEMSLTMTLCPNDVEKAIEYIAKCKDALSKRA